MNASPKKGPHFIFAFYLIQSLIEVSPGCMPCAPPNLPLIDGGRLIGAISRTWIFLWPLSGNFSANAFACYENLTRSSKSSIYFEWSFYNESIRGLL